jgi:hypothetical protein
LPELFQTAGCQFEFSAKAIQPLTKLLREELEKLGTGRKLEACPIIKPLHGLLQCYG